MGTVLVSIHPFSATFPAACDVPRRALCFGWIDSTYRPLSSTLGMQRYTPRRKISENYSQPNVERLQWLDRKKLIHPEVGWRGCVGGRFFLVGGWGRVGIDQRGRLIDGVTVVAET